MSIYLNRLKHLRDAETPIGATANVQTNISFRKAIDYIEKLEKQEVYLLARLKEANAKAESWRTQSVNIKLIADHELRTSIERKNLIELFIDKGAQYYNHDSECYEGVTELIK